MPWLIYKRNDKHLFWPIKHLGEVLNYFTSKGFLASSVSTYDFSILYTTLPNNIIEEKRTDIIEQTFISEGSLYSVCNKKHAFSTSKQPKRYDSCSCQAV